MHRAKGIEEMGEDRLGVLENLASTSSKTIKSGPLHVAMVSYLKTIAKKAWLSERVDLMIKHATNLVVPDGTLLVQKGDMIHHLIIVLNDGGLLVSADKCYERGKPFGEKSLVSIIFFLLFCFGGVLFLLIVYPSLSHSRFKLVVPIMH